MRFGKPMGTKQMSKKTVRVRFNTPSGPTPYINTTFQSSDYGDDMLATLGAAEMFRYQYSKVNGLLKNEWRFVSNTITDDLFVETRMQTGQFAETDPDALHFIEEYIWGVDANGYVAAWDTKNSKRLLLHRLILPGHRMVDHIDNNRLNNRKSNLRPATFVINGRNRKSSKNNKSGVNGVYKRKIHGRRNYVASWNDDNGKKREKPFSYLKFHGKKGAFAAAVEFRSAIDKELGYTIHYTDHAKRTREEVSSDDAEPPSKRTRLPDKAVTD